jgi:hypothetical protein
MLILGDDPFQIHLTCFFEERNARPIHVICVNDWEKRFASDKARSANEAKGLPLREKRVQRPYSTKQLRLGSRHTSVRSMKTASGMRRLNFGKACLKTSGRA